MTSADQPTQNGVLPVVLAAGLGTRMKSSKPKVLHDLCGRPMLAYVLDAARAVSDRRPLVVYSPRTAASKSWLSPPSTCRPDVARSWLSASGVPTSGLNS